MSEMAASSGVFFGVDKSDPNASGVEIFRNPQNQPKALATLLSVTQNRVNYDPTTQEAHVAAKAFHRYLQAIAKIPYLSLINNTRSERKIEEKNKHKLINGILSLFNGITGFDGEKVKNSLGELFDTVSTCRYAEETRSYFGQFTIAAEESKLKLYVHHTELKVKHDARGIAEIIDQSYTVNISEYELLSQVMACDAERLSSLRLRAVDDWFNDIKAQPEPVTYPQNETNSLENSETEDSSCVIL
jgi:hypothetical protein